MKTTLAATAIIISLAAANSAQAYDQSAFVGGLGYTQAMDNEDNGTVANIEYRSSDADLGIKNVSWIAGAEADTNSSAYAYAGLLYDLPLSENWSLTPSVAAGVYEQGDSKDLGGVFEFRDTIELNYKITPATRVGIALNHKSNASIYDKNPGTETIQAIYSMQLN